MVGLPLECDRQLDFLVYLFQCDRHVIVGIGFRAMPIDRQTKSVPPPNQFIARHERRHGYVALFGPSLHDFKPPLGYGAGFAGG